MPPTRTNAGRPRKKVAGAPRNRTRPKTICPHCNKELSSDTIQRHMQAAIQPPVPLNPGLIEVLERSRTSARQNALDDADSEHISSDDDEEPNVSHFPTLPSMTRNDSDVDVNMATSLSDLATPAQFEDVDIPLPCSPQPSTPLPHLPSSNPSLPRATVPSHAPLRVTIEEVPDEDELHDQEVDENGDEAQDVNWNAELTAEEEERYGYYEGVGGLSLEDMIMESLEQDLQDIEPLTPEELAQLRHFALKVESHMTDDTFEDLRWAFPSDHVQSWKKTKATAALLSGITPVRYDCCINSCCLFAGPNAEKQSCSECNEPRYRDDGKPRSRFLYFPLIPRLAGYFRNLSMIDKLKYRAAYQKHANGDVEDVFDGTLYERLCKAKVNVGNVEMPYTHFQFKRDLALGLSTDGFAPWRRRKKTCWPLLIFIYDLPPEIRFHLENILCVGVIPGPKKPKDFDSFIWPLIQELMQLSTGVSAFDVQAREQFLLHAYLMLIFGDIPAISLAARLTGHNGVRPCRMCNIRGIVEPDGRTNYVPLDRSRHPDVLRGGDSVVKKYDPLALPLRSHEEMVRQATEVQMHPLVTHSSRLATEYGIKGTSIFYNLSSVVFPDSFPYDFMHLMYENVLKNLVLLWTGKFKDLDEGNGRYQFASGIWDKIGEASAASGKYIPSVFGAKPPNPAEDKQAMTADSWSFWMLHLAPVVLQGRFQQAIYYKHFIELVKIVFLCLQFTNTCSDIEKIRKGLKDWVVEYERLYYQNNPDRMRACPVTIHALLHIADSIQVAGPVWTYWAFPMERFCGQIQPAIKSRRHPFACIDNYITMQAQLSHIRIVHNVREALTMPSRLRRKQELPQRLEVFSIPNYPSCILLSPKRRLSVNDAVHNKIVTSLCTRFKVSAAVINQHYVKETTEQWAKVRRLEGGDDMKASALDGGNGEDRRDATWVRYEQLVDIYAHRQNVAPVYDLRLFYGQLQHLLVVHLPATDDLQLNIPTTLILAYIHACKDVKLENPLKMPYYTKMGRHEVVDITLVQCLVGRIPPDTSRQSKKWAIIDRSHGRELAEHIPDEQ